MKRINQHYVNQILADKTKLTTFSDLIETDTDMGTLILVQIALCEVPKITRAVILTLELPHDADVWVEA